MFLFPGSVCGAAAPGPQLLASLQDLRDAADSPSLPLSLHQVRLTPPCRPPLNQEVEGLNRGSVVRLQMAESCLAQDDCILSQLLPVSPSIVLPSLGVGLHHWGFL